MRIKKTLFKTYELTDYVPIASSIKSLFELFNKLILSFNNNSININNFKYFRYLKNRSNLRCVVLFIPIFGNVSIAIYDIKKNYCQSGRKKAKEDPGTKTSVNKAKEDLDAENLEVSACLEDTVKESIQAIKEDHWALLHLPTELQNSEEFLLKALEVNPFIISLLSDAFKKNEKFLFKALKKNGEVFNYIDAEFRDDRQFVIKVINKNPAVFPLLQKEFQEELEIALIAVRKSYWIFHHLNKELQNNEEVKKSHLP